MKRFSLYKSISKLEFRPECLPSFMFYVQRRNRQLACLTPVFLLISLYKMMRRHCILYSVYHKSKDTLKKYKYLRQVTECPIALAVFDWRNDFDDFFLGPGREGQGRSAGVRSYLAVPLAVTQVQTFPVVLSDSLTFFHKGYQLTLMSSSFKVQKNLLMTLCQVMGPSHLAGS